MVIRVCKSLSSSKGPNNLSQVLTHYANNSSSRCACIWGGCSYSRVFPDNTEHPIAFASCTLTASEQNYAQLEKEVLALIFGIQKFHRYLYDRKFTFITDHNPLTTILGSKKGIPSLAATRLQRWAILLSAYDNSYNGHTKCHNI